MAKIFDILRRSETRIAAPALPVTNFAPAAKVEKPIVAEVVAAPIEIEEEVPYIEVGPNRELTGSDSVLKLRPIPPRAPTPLVAPKPVVEKPSPVAFRPLPRKLATDASPRMADEIITFHDPKHPVSEQYRSLLRCSLEAMSSDKAVLLLTTALRETAVTGVVLNLAVTAARSGKQVIVIDGIGPVSKFLEKLGLPNGPGLSEALAGAVPLDRVLHVTAQERLLAMSAGVAPMPRGMTAHALLAQLRERCDLVFLESPRWDGRAEQAALAAACDGVFLVVPESEAETPQVKDLLQVIPEQGGRLAGYILAG